jgi:hypothetical protein
MGKFFNRALLVIAFFTVLFATVHATDINLALGKSATQSSNYNTTLYHASQAVNGNTQGVWYNNSIIKKFTHMRYAHNPSFSKKNTSLKKESR